MKRYVVLGVLVVCTGLAAAGIEFDNSENGTSQEWNFVDMSFPGWDIAPEGGGQNPNGPATAVVDYGLATGTGSHRLWSGAQSGNHHGVYYDQENLGVSITIPNYVNDNPYKKIYVEIIYWGEISDEAVMWDGMTATEPDVSENILLPDGWSEYSAIWTIQPNPTVETIQYSFVPGAQAEVQLDYILVQTSCIPEPATLLLFGLGGLVLRKKRQG